MAQVAGSRTTNQTITETRLVRNVANEMAELEPNNGALITFLEKLKKKFAVDAPRHEWTEDDFVARWTTAASTINSSATALDVADGTLFAVGDLFVQPNAASSSTVPEVVRVTAISTNTLTIVRGTGAATITSGNALRIIGSAFEEGAASPAAKTTAPSMKISYTEIFKAAFDFTRTNAVSNTYGAPQGDYERTKAKRLAEMKQQINGSFLFGRASESLTGGPSGNPIRQTMGLNSVVTTNVTDGVATLTRKLFETFSQSSFRYANGPRMLLASPTIISAINQWAQSHLILQPSETVFGVTVTKFKTGHGDWMLVRDWMLENGVSGKNGFNGWAFSLDPDSMGMFHLRGLNGLHDGQPHLEEGIQANDVDGLKSQYVAEIGLRIQQEKRFAKLYDVTDWES